MSIESEVEAQILGSVEAEHHLDRFAKQIADEVRELTPEFGDHPPKRNEPGIGDPGDLKESIQVSPLKRPGRRRVESHDPKALWAELGAKHFPEVGMFAQVAHRHGGTGPVIEDDGVQHAQEHYRRSAASLAEAVAEGNATSIAAARAAHALATQNRSAAFRAARGGGRGRRR